jgi:hypothetical protein
MISGSASEEDRQAAVRLRPTLTIWKPCTPADVSAAIERVFPKERWQSDQQPKRADEQA